MRHPNLVPVADGGRRVDGGPHGWPHPVASTAGLQLSLGANLISEWPRDRGLRRLILMRASQIRLGINAGVGALQDPGSKPMAIRRNRTSSIMRGMSGRFSAVASGISRGNAAILSMLEVVWFDVRSLLAAPAAGTGLATSPTLVSTCVDATLEPPAGPRSSGRVFQMSPSRRSVRLDGQPARKPRHTASQ